MKENPPEGGRHGRLFHTPCRPALLALAAAAHAARRAAPAVLFKSLLLFAGEAGLPGACSSFSDTLLAQTPVPVERVTFEEGISRAIARNPSTAIASAGILRAEALLTEARSATRPQINGNVTTTTLNRGVEFDGATVTPRNQATASLDARMPLYAPARWARRAQSEDGKRIAEANAADVKQQTAFAAADAYLTIIARRRVVEANERARDVAKAHFDLAHQLQERGTGSRLNELRAQQEWSLDEGLVESARLSLYRAQEALGILLVADGPVDAMDEPALDVPADAITSTPNPQGFWRPDLRLYAAQQQAAERVLHDSPRDALPFLEGVFQPSSTYPSQFFLPQNSWRFLLQMSVPLLDGGLRRGQRTERRAALDISQATLMSAMTTATSEVRAAREAVASAERGLASARAGADQARQVVDIVNISFRAGAATNIEVIDAERRARDADTTVAVAEDTLRRGRLELLTALGRFP
jgi:outer membrane protein